MAGHSEQILKVIKSFNQFTVSESGQDELFIVPPIHHFNMADKAECIWEGLAHENQEFQANLAGDASRAY